MNCAKQVDPTCALENEGDLCDLTRTRANKRKRVFTPQPLGGFFLPQPGSNMLAFVAQIMLQEPAYAQLFMRLLVAEEATDMVCRAPLSNPNGDLACGLTDEAAAVLARYESCAFASGSTTGRVDGELCEVELLDENGNRVREAGVCRALPVPGLAPSAVDPTVATGDDVQDFLNQLSAALQQDPFFGRMTKCVLPDEPFYGTSGRTECAQQAAGALCLQNAPVNDAELLSRFRCAALPATQTPQPVLDCLYSNSTAAPSADEQLSAMYNPCADKRSGDECAVVLGAGVVNRGVCARLAEGDGKVANVLGQRALPLFCSTSLCPASNTSPCASADATVGSPCAVDVGGGGVVDGVCQATRDEQNLFCSLQSTPLSGICSSI